MRPVRPLPVPRHDRQKPPVSIGIVPFVIDHKHFYRSGHWDRRHSELARVASSRFDASIQRGRRCRQMPASGRYSCVHARRTLSRGAANERRRRIRSPSPTRVVPEIIVNSDPGVLPKSRTAVPKTRRVAASTRRRCESSQAANVSSERDRSCAFRSVRILREPGGAW